MQAKSVTVALGAAVVLSTGPARAEPDDLVSRPLVLAHIIDRAEPDLTARIVADKLQLFAAPDRQLSLSGNATMANGGAAGGLDIDGKFTVDHALFDLPEQSAPRLSDDVVIVSDERITEEIFEKRKPVP